MLRTLIGDPGSLMQVHGGNPRGTRSLIQPSNALGQFFSWADCASESTILGPSSSCSTLLSLGSALAWFPMSSERKEPLADGGDIDSFVREAASVGSCLEGSPFTASLSNCSSLDSGSSFFDLLGLKVNDHLRRLLISAGVVAEALSSLLASCLCSMFVSMYSPPSRLFFRFRDGGGELCEPAVVVSGGLSVDSSGWLSSSELPSEALEFKSECRATYTVVSMKSSKFRLKTTRFGCGKNTFLLESLGLALTEALLGGRGEFFRIGLTPNGNDKVYGC